MIRLFKLFSLITFLSFYGLGAFLAYCFINDQVERRAFLVRWTHHLSPALLSLLGICYSTESPHDLSGVEGRNYLIVSNHLSYIDALILTAAMPTVFVTSVEVKNSPFLGLLARAAGCLFVERRSRASLSNDVDEISEVLQQGFNVVIFPEGTTSPGETVLPFKKSLFESAIRAKASVLPVCLNYRCVDGGPVYATKKDSLFYYGEMEFFPHLWSLLNLDEVWVEVNVLAEIPLTAESTRKELTSVCYSSITEKFLPIRSQPEDFPLGIAMVR
jgi:1-acyl-sn-glycerol-3-phosphate acyltransferase